MEALTVMVMGGTTITESRLRRNSETSDLGSLSACKVIEKKPTQFEGFVPLEVICLLYKTVMLVLLSVRGLNHSFVIISAVITR
jgi:hypothetical protein